MVSEAKSDIILKVLSSSGFFQDFFFALGFLLFKNDMPKYNFGGHLTLIMRIREYLVELYLIKVI